MRNGIRILTMLGAFLVAFSQAPSANAQASRTWVSGVGDDANPCSRTAPCKTWAGAISKTAVSNTTVTNNAANGISVAPSGGSMSVYVTGVQANKNGNGFNVAPTGAAAASMTVDRSSASLNTGNGAQASGTGTILVSD